MAKQKTKESPYVTQGQWMEGMEMIKEFFGTVVTSIKKLEKCIGGLEKRVGSVEKRMGGVEKRMGGLEEDNREIKYRLGNLERDNQEIKENVEMNTQAINLLSKQQQETQKLEFDIFHHEQRIIKLEKTR